MIALKAARAELPIPLPSEQSGNTRQFRNRWKSWTASNKKRDVTKQSYYFVY